MPLKAYNEDSDDDADLDWHLRGEERDPCCDKDPAFTTPAFRKGKGRRCPLDPRGFQGTIEEGRRKVDLTVSFPVVEGIGKEEPTWEPLHLKTLKGLKSAIKTSGLSAPYTIQLLDMVARHCFTPHE